jgi:hypothetical protein
MKNKFALICLVAVTFGFSACEKNNDNVQEIGYGTSFGMCIDYCVNNISLGAGEVKYSKSKNGSVPDTKTCTKKMAASEMDALKALVKQNDFQKLPAVIGCPDCADGGAEWIALKINGKVKKVTFEYGKAPSAVKELAVKLKEIKNSFKDCN